MASIQDFCCVVCGHQYSFNSTRYTCDFCGEVGTLDIRYDLKALSASIDRVQLFTDHTTTSMWRYHDLLPISDHSHIPPLNVGGTPMYELNNLAEELGLARVWIKDEGVNPTASLKDRASAMVVAHALEDEYRTVSTASTGNAAAALAGITASVPGLLNTVIFVPRTAPIAKITQLQIYGAEVMLVKGTYNEAFDLCFTLSKQNGWHCRNTGINPYTSEGKKTAAFEIAECLGWRVPSAVMVSVGDGSIIGSLYKGFQELLELDWISDIPRLIGVQAEGSSALYQAWSKGLDAAAMIAANAETVADSISADLPRDRAKALRAVRESNGAFITVSDEAILQAIPDLAQRTGIFAEPAAAAAFAGTREAVSQNLLGSDDEIVILSTGNGLKDVPAAQRALKLTGKGRVRHLSTNFEEANEKLQDLI